MSRSEEKEYTRPFLEYDICKKMTKLIKSFKTMLSKDFSFSKFTRLSKVY